MRLTFSKALEKLNPWRWFTILAIYFISVTLFAFLVKTYTGSFWTSWAIVSVIGTGIIATLFVMYLTVTEKRSGNAKSPIIFAFAFGTMATVGIVILSLHLYTSPWIHLGYVNVMYLTFCLADHCFSKCFHRLTRFYNTALSAIDLPSLIGFIFLFIISLSIQNSFSPELIEAFIAGAIVFEIFGAHAGFAVLKSQTL